MKEGGVGKGGKGVEMFWSNFFLINVIFIFLCFSNESETTENIE